jgi:hypothetical protein
MGQLTDHPLQTIWNNKNYRDFRKKILHSRKSIDICSNCTEGTRVWV